MCFVSSVLVITAFGGVLAGQEPTDTIAHEAGAPKYPWLGSRGLPA